MLRNWSWRIAGALALACVAIVGVARAEEPEPFVPTEATFEAELEAASAGMVEELRAYAAWCREWKLFLDRERALENLLVFAPDDRETHLFLRHRLQKDGSWLVPEKRKPAKNANDRKLEESAELRAAFTDEFCRRVFGAVEHFDDVTPERRAEVHEIVLALDPEHAGVRELRGEKLLDGEWVLAETLRAKSRRAEIKGIVKQSFAEVGPLMDLTYHMREEKIGVDWKATARTQNVRVLSTGSADEAERIARATQATIGTFRKVMGVANRPFPVMTVYLLTKTDQRDLFISNWPTWGPTRLDDMRKLAGSGLLKSLDVARWDESEEHRLDGTVRHTIGMLLQRDFGITVEVPWAWEGIGLFLTRELVGTRMTWYGVGVASPAAAHQDFIRKVMDNEVNWINAGFVRLQGADGPRLVDVLGKPLPDLDIYDFLVAYVFGAYLMEGRPDDLPRLMAAVGRQRKPHEEALPAVLGIQLADMEAHLIRWLEERR